MGDKPNNPSGLIDMFAGVAVARDPRDEFLARSCVGYVIIDRTQATAELQTFARDVLRLSRMLKPGFKAVFQA